MIPIRRERVAQRAVHALPGGEYLWARRGQRDAAVDPEQFARLDDDAEIAGRDAERIEAGDQFRFRDDAGAASGQFVLDALENVDAPAAPPQHDGGEEAAHRATDHDRAALPRHAFSSYFKICRRFL